MGKWEAVPYSKYHLDLGCLPGTIFLPGPAFCLVGMVSLLKRLLTSQPLGHAFRMRRCPVIVQQFRVLYLLSCIILLQDVAAFSCAGINILFKLKSNSSDSSQQKS